MFTIDPLTARDLDDAVSVKELPNGNYEIGVHISDASYYLAEGKCFFLLTCEKLFMLPVTKSSIMKPFCLLKICVECVYLFILQNIYLFHHLSLL